MKYEIRQFDRIRLKTTRNIHYLSAPPGEIPSPHGVWIVVGNIGKDLVVSKDDAVCRVPVEDITLAGRAKSSHLMEQINGEKEHPKKEN